MTPFALNMVEATLKQKGAACLDKTVEKWGAGAAPGTRTKSTSTYVPTVERNTAGVVELTVRVRHNPRGIGSPPDGVFLLAADLRAQESKTEVDLYAMTFAYDHIADAVRGWLRGEDTPCPELD